MKDSLQPGLKFEFQFEVPDTKTVPHLYPESPEFQAHAPGVGHRVHGGALRMGLHPGPQPPPGLAPGADRGHRR